MKRAILASLLALAGYVGTASSAQAQGYTYDPVNRQFVPTVTASGYYQSQPTIVQAVASQVLPQYFGTTSYYPSNSYYQNSNYGYGNNGYYNNGYRNYNNGYYNNGYSNYNNGYNNYSYPSIGFYRNSGSRGGRGYRR